MTPFHLTPREAEILQLIWQGKRSKDIGQLLGISHRTVHAHRYHLMQHLGARNAAQMLNIAISAGLVQP